jgi:hypothetical protein
MWGSLSQYSCPHEAQINFGDLTPYLTFASSTLEIHLGLGPAVKRKDAIYHLRLE